jgi:hypothetical protein
MTRMKLLRHEASMVVEVEETLVSTSFYHEIFVFPVLRGNVGKSP